MVETVSCVHHWLVDSPSGDNISKGVCKKCHKEGEFKNTITYSEWYGFNKTKPGKNQRFFKRWNKEGAK